MALRMSTTRGRQPAQTGGGRTGSRDYYNQDGPGNTTIDYGPHGPRDPTPSYTPNDPSYFIQANPALEAQKDASIAAAHARNRAAYGGDPAYAQAAAGGDLRGAIARMSQMKQDAQRQRFIDQGGQGSTWDTRYQQDWPVPASPTGNYQYGPGRPGPTPPGVAGGSGGAPPGGTGGGAPPGRTISGIPTGAASGGIRRGGGVVDSPMGQPMQGGGDMIGALQAQGYQIGRAGPAPAGGPDRSAWMGMMSGGYNPGASTGTAGLYGDPSMYSGGAQPGGFDPMSQAGAAPAGLMQWLQSQQMGGGFNPMAAMEMAGQGRSGGYLPPGFGGGGRTPINPGGPTQFPINPGNRSFSYQPPQFQGQMPMERMGGMLGIPGFSPYGGGFY